MWWLGASKISSAGRRINKIRCIYKSFSNSKLKSLIAIESFQDHSLREIHLPEDELKEQFGFIVLFRLKQDPHKKVEMGLLRFKQF